MKPKRNRWGYGSYDVGEDNYDINEEKTDWSKENEENDLADGDDSNLRLIYTRITTKGDKSRVDQFADNGDGGHSHYQWKSEEDFHAGNKPDWGREESNDRGNPKPGEIDDESGGCYLTTACMHHHKYNFDDNCAELQVLRWFRDNYCSKEDIDHYYEVAPKIVKFIDSRTNKEDFYEHIYNAVILESIMAIGSEKYDTAYQIYKSNVEALETVSGINKKESVHQPKGVIEDEEGLEK